MKKTPVQINFYHNKGISLVEIMIALVLGLMVSAGVMQVYLSNKQSYRLAQEQSRLQENARFALEFLTNDIRMAGYMGCLSRSLTLVNTLNTPNNYLYDFTIPVQGFEWNQGTTAWLPAIDASITSSLNGSDIITIRRADTDGITVTQHPGGSPPGSADLKLSGPGTPSLQDCDIVVVSDCSAAAVFQITNFNAANNNNTVHNTGAAGCSPNPGPGNATKELGKSYVGGEVYRIRNNSYYIRTNPNNQPALYRRTNAANAEELVEGIEQMLVLYGVDTSGDGTANRYFPANTVPSWNQVVSVRITLLVRSIENNLITQQAAFNFNGVAVPVADRRLRRQFTTTVGVRNRLR
jgi:type IV pilus assembly protein PilW